MVWEVDCVEDNKSHTSKKYLAKRDGEIGIESRRIRSRTAMRCGDVKRPIL